MPIGAKLQTLLNEKNTNVNEVAVATGISPNTLYSLIRRDSEKASIDDLYRVAHYLGVSLNYFTEQSLSDAVEQFDPILKKYRALDEHGTKIVDFVLNEEYERCVSAQEAAVPALRIIPFSLLRASAGSGEWLDSENMDEIEIPDIPENRDADFALEVSGDSMEPTYHDGDVVLVHRQDEVNVGDIGIFIVDGRGYIKEQGEDRLISHNPEYADIYPSKDAYIKCCGRVIGKV